MDTKHTVTVRTHLYHVDQLKGFSGSSGPFHEWMILPSSVVFSAPGTPAASFRPLSGPPCSVLGGVVESDEKYGESSASCVSLPFCVRDRDVMGTYQAGAAQAADALISRRLARTFRVVRVVDSDPIFRYGAATSSARSRIVNKTCNFRDLRAFFHLKYVVQVCGTIKMDLLWITVQAENAALSEGSFRLHRHR